MNQKLYETVEIDYSKEFNLMMEEDEAYEELSASNLTNDEDTIPTKHLFNRYSGFSLDIADPRHITSNWVRNKMHTPVTKMPFQVNWDGLAEMLKKYTDPNMLPTLNKIYFVYDEKDIDELENETGDEYAQELIDLDELLGINWTEMCIVVVNLRLLEEKCTEYAPYEGVGLRELLNKEIISTLVHELRHMMMETNPLLPVEVYPDSEACEDAVEAYGERFARSMVQKGYNFVSLPSF